MSCLDEFRDRITAFEKTADRYARYGAQDTEPDGIFQSLLVLTFLGKKPQLPQGVDGWDLYDEMAGNGLAAANLSRSAEACLRCLENIPLREAGAVERFLKGYCWRITW